MLRGCALVFNQDWRKRFGTRFTHWDIQGHEEVLTERLKKLPLLDAELVSGAKEALMEIEHIAKQGDEVVQVVWRHLVEIVELCCVCCNAGMSLFYLPILHSAKHH